MITAATAFPGNEDEDGAAFFLGGILLAAFLPSFLFLALAALDAR